MRLKKKRKLKKNFCICPRFIGLKLRKIQNSIIYRKISKKKYKGLKGRYRERSTDLEKTIKTERCDGDSD